MVLGTPCNPFSTQRAKRFASGDVKQHVLYKHTFADVFAMLDTYRPATATMEQSFGFDLPFSTEEAETPMSRPDSWDTGNPEIRNIHDWQLIFSGSWAERHDAICVLPCLDLNLLTPLSKKGYEKPKTQSY